MRKNSAFLFCLFISVTACSQNNNTGVVNNRAIANNTGIAIIPEPVNIVQNTGTFPYLKTL
jgi:hypothetical protein